MSAWLGISLDEQPPNHYRLLGLKRFTSDRSAIDHAAEMALKRVRQAAGDANQTVAEKLIAKIEIARECLLDTERKAAYDAKLRGGEPTDTAKKLSTESNSKLVLMLGGIVAIAAIFVGAVIYFGGSGDGENQDEDLADMQVRKTHPDRQLPGKNNGPENQQPQNSEKKSVSGKSETNSKKPASTSSKKLASNTKPIPVKKKSVSPNQKVIGKPVRALKPGEGRIVNLLKLVNPVKNAVRSRWILNAKGLQCISGPSEIELPYDVPEEYEFHFTATRIPKAGFPELVIGLPARDRRIGVVLDHFRQGDLHGFLGLDGRVFVPDYSLVKGPLRKDGVPSNIVCRVTKEGVKVTVDGRLIIEWKGDYSRFANKISTSRNLRYLTVGGVSRTSYLFSKLELRKLPYDKPLLPQLAVPNEVELKKALKLVRKTFKKEFSQSKSSLTKATLANKLLKQSTQKGNQPAVRYVLLQEAGKLALELDDIEMMMKVIDLKAELFEIDKFSERLAALKIFNQSIRSKTKIGLLGRTAFNDSKLALKKELFTTSLELASLARTAANRSRNSDLARQAMQLRTEIITVKDWFQEAAKARRTLDQNPNDPQANFIQGQFLCFIKQDWKSGLALLVKSENSELQKIAAQDFASPTGEQERLALADAWHQLADSKEWDDFQKSQFRKRAGYWYQKALPKLTGLSKTRAENRIQAITEAPATPVVAVSQKLGKNTNKNSKEATSTVVAVWEISSFNRQTDRVVFYSNGKTNHGHKWSMNPDEFSFGFDSSGKYVSYPYITSGRWQRGGYYTSRLIMSGVNLKSEPAEGVKISKSSGNSVYGKLVSGDLDKTMIDAWQFTATSLPSKKFVNLTLDFTSDYQVIDTGRKIGTWKIEKRRLIINFLDEQFGEFSLGLKNRNEFSGRTYPKNKIRWTIKLKRVQIMAVLQSKKQGKMVFYSNHRVQSPRAEKGQGYYWHVVREKSGNRKLHFGWFSTTYSKDGRSIHGRGAGHEEMIGRFISGTLLRK
ncbi:MAG: hypothetical protein Tsb009_10420 [Planctomycetaceae bacterium]